MTLVKNTQNKKKLLHASMPNFGVKNSQLLVGGLTLSHIEKLVGRTPYYAYDKNLISEKVKQLKSQLPSGIKIHYAIKANPLSGLVHFMSTLVDGFDVASKKEMLLGLQSGATAKNMSFAGPGKLTNDLESAIIAGVTLHAESASEIERIINIGLTLNIKPKMAIRVNPKFELKSSGMTMGGGSKPFGIDEEQIPQILSSLPLDNIHFRGFHIFAGSQNLNADAIIEMHRKTFKLAHELLTLSPTKIDYINIGGGLGIPYFPGEENLDLSPISKNLSQLLIDYKDSFLGIELIMELGRYLVGESGIYVSKVVDTKESRGSKYLVCDGGLHHHLANSGNFGQVIRKNYPTAIGNKITGPEQIEQHETEKVTIVGPLCTPLDIIANNVVLPKAVVGDYIVVFQSGAYGATASPQEFLSQPSLAEIIL